MTGTFAGWLIKTEVITYGDLGRLTKEWVEYRDSRDWTERMLSFTTYLTRQYPDQWTAYQTYCRLTSYQPYNKDKQL